MFRMRSDRDVERYTSPSRFEAERRVVFRRLPLVVGRDEELALPGRFFTHDAAGVPLLMTRDPRGALHAMLKVCTHRSTRLVDEERGDAESFVCKLHAWRFDLCGKLARPGRTSLPQELEQFMDDRSLVDLPCESRHGFLWVVPTARAGIDIAASLGPSLDAELEALGLAELVEVRRQISTRPGNWKLLMETLLDHARPGAVIPIFPSSVLVVTNEAVSHLAVFPATVDEVTCVHTQLARHAPATDAEREALADAWLDAGDVLFEEKSEADRTPEDDARRRRFEATVDRVIAAHPLRAG